MRQKECVGAEIPRFRFMRRARNFLSVIDLIFSTLLQREKRRLRLILVVQLFVSVFELVALASTGAVISLAIRASSSQGPGDRVSALLTRINLDNLPLKNLILLLAFFSLFVFVLRSLATLWFTRVSLKYSGEISARLSGELAGFLLSGLSSTRQLKLNPQELAYAVTGGSVRLLSGMLGAATLLTADIILLSVVLVGLFLVDAASTSIMLAYFAVLATVMHLLTIKKNRVSSRRSTETNLDSSHFFLETLALYREFNLRNLIPERVQKFSQYRITFSRFQAYLQLLPLLSKYVLELGIIVGITFISLIQLLEFDFARSSATLALFLIAGSRLAPSVFRLQQNFGSILGTLESTQATQTLIRFYNDWEKNVELDILRSVSEETRIKSFNLEPNPDYSSKGVTLEVFGLYFDFNQIPSLEFREREMLLKDLSFFLKPNSLNALIGKSGIGKSTLADIIIGARQPFQGQILMDGISNTSFIRSRPGKVSFVPQNPILLDGSLRFNVALKEEVTELEEKWIEKLLNDLGLGELHRSLPQGLRTSFNFGNRQLSGGQLQRLALARAMFTKPRLLVVDEYTSALDAESEARVTEFVQESARLCTVLIITHRYKSIVNCTNYLVLKSGQLWSFSDLDEAREFLG